MSLKERIEAMKLPGNNGPARRKCPRSQQPVAKPVYNEDGSIEFTTEKK